mgnify:FL=1
MVQCTGAVIGQSTVLTVPQCVDGAQYPPVVFTGYNTGSFEHVFVADQMWIPKSYNSCVPCTYTTFPQNSDQGHNLVLPLILSRRFFSNALSTPGALPL